MNIALHPIRRLCVLLVALCLFGSPVWGQDTRKILILPFTVHSEKDLTFLKQGAYDMLSTRLAQEGKVTVVGRQETEKMVADLPVPVTESQAVSLAKAAGADYAVVGSLTVFGDSISTDVRCVDVAGAAPVVTFSQAGKTQGDVIAHINIFARQVNEQVFGRKPAPAETAAAAQPVPDSRKHPDKIWQESSGGIMVYGAQSTEGQASFAVWKSRKFPGDITGTSVGDVDGDGNSEIVFIQDTIVHVYRYAGGQFLRVVEFKEPSYHRFLGVDVADINGNGLAEIYVTDLPINSDRLRSFVLEWNGKTFEKIADGANWYYRVLDIPNRGKVLMGQERGTVTDTFGENELYTGSVFEMRWQNNRLEPVERQLLPRRVNIYGFTMGDLLNDGGEMVAAFTPRDYIRVTDRSGNVEWTSDEPYGGSDTFMELRTERKEDERVDDVQMDRFFLRQRLHITDIDGDGKNELLVVKNYDATGRFMEQTRYYKSGHIECLAWDAIGMRIKWKTQKSGYISDYVIADLDNDGRNEVVFAVTLKSGLMSGKSRSYLASLALRVEKP